MNSLIEVQRKSAMVSWLLSLAEEDMRLGRDAVEHWLERALLWADGNHDPRAGKIRLMLDFVRGVKLTAEEMRWVREGLGDRVQGGHT